MAIDLSLHTKQGTALQSVATEVLYGGAAGGGKSHLMRAAAIIWCSMIPGLQVYLFRRIREDLVKNHIEGPKGLRAMLAPWSLSGLVTIVEDEIRFWNGSKIYLCHCKDEKDRFKYLGAEIHVLLIDELTTFTEVIYRFLRGRVRAVGLNLPTHLKGLFPRILCGSNPGNVGHGWVKSGFVDAAPPIAVRQMGDAEGGMRRQYIPARLDDNPSMSTDDPTYRARLRGLGNDALVRAMESGDWDIIAGAFFTRFNRQRHVIAPLELPRHWTRFRCFDWGSAKPFACYWLAVSDGEIGSIARGAIVVYRELYGALSPDVGLKLDAEDVARRIVAREPSTEVVNYGVCDPAAFKVDGGPSIAERMARHTDFHLTWRPADNSRINGWDQLNGRLGGDADGRPMLLIFDTCVDLIRTLPTLQHDEHRPEDVDTDSEDHAADALRYGLMSRPYTRPKPEPERPITAPPTLNDLWSRAGLPDRDTERI